MTTPARTAAYLSEHLEKVADRGWSVVNPNNVPVADLPVIFGFNNGGRWTAVSRIDHVQRWRDGVRILGNARVGAHPNGRV